jgi:diadenosine tetraphosphatase ApaH/serine/threonine PP2A family protein phosphatase
MRIAIVSDVHANLFAFEAVLRHAEADGPIDVLWSLGDVVGYGPNPNECIAQLRTYEHLAVVGNHDLVACGLMGSEEFNDIAASAAHWTATRLTAESREYLARLPKVVTKGEFTLVHGSLRFPEWEYLLSGEQALVQFELQNTAYSIVGHSHLAFLCGQRLESADGPPLSKARPSPPTVLVPAGDGERVELGSERLILNPGSVGQPRDGDPRAGYALYDQEARTMTWHRVEYDIAATQEAIERAGLPRWLSQRLSLGR